MWASLLSRHIQPTALICPRHISLCRKLRKQKEDGIRAVLEEKAKAQAFANALSTIGKFVLKKKAGDKDQLYSTCVLV